MVGTTLIHKYVCLILSVKKEYPTWYTLKYDVIERKIIELIRNIHLSHMNWLKLLFKISFELIIVFLLVAI